MSEQPKPFAQMSRTELIAEIKRLRSEPENAMTIEMLLSAGFVSAQKVSQARKIARDVMATGNSRQVLGQSRASTNRIASSRDSKHAA